MKKIFGFLERWAFELSILFVSCPYAPEQIYKNYGVEWLLTYCFTLFAVSFFVTLFCLYWLKSDHISMKPGALMMLTGGGMLGLMISVSTLLVLYGILPAQIYLLFRDLPSLFLISLILLGAYFHFSTK